MKNTTYILPKYAVWALNISALCVYGIAVNILLNVILGGLGGVFGDYNTYVAVATAFQPVIAAIVALVYTLLYKEQFYILGAESVEKIEERKKAKLKANTDGVDRSLF